MEEDVKEVKEVREDAYILVVGEFYKRVVNQRIVRVDEILGYRATLTIVLSDDVKEVGEKLTVDSRVNESHKLYERIYGSE